MNLNIGIIAIFLGLTFTSSAQYYFEYSKEIHEIYTQIIQLDLEEAEIALQDLEDQNPNNLCIVHMQNYVDFFRVFLGEDIKTFERLEKRKKLRLNQLEQGSKDSPYYRYIKAEIILQWALMRIKFDEKWTAFFEINKALGLLQENEERFPDFIENKKSLSLLHSLIGTIPESFADLLSFFTNFEGSIEKGAQEIDAVLQYASDDTDFLFFEESIIIKTFIMAHLQNKPKEALRYMETQNFSATQGPLHVYTIALLFHKSGDNDQAIQILEESLAAGHGEKLIFLYCMIGHYKSCRLDADADYYLKYYAENFQGRHYIKEAWQKLAWHSLYTKDDESNYLSYLEKCSKTGFTLTEEDKQAQKEAEEKRIPNTSLLKARLLFDGAYYHRAEKELEQALWKNKIEEENRIYYHYRMARIQHKQKKFEEAIKFYQTVISMDQSKRLYQSCNSKLQIGLIHEIRGNFVLAKQYFNQCLQSSPETYERSLHQKAKAGLNRISTIK